MYRSMTIRSAAAVLLLCAGALPSANIAEAASPVPCGALYTVERGDTLFKIADRAYADGWKFKAIHAANRDLLPTAESLEVGDQILVPCADGSGPATRAEALAALVPAAPSAEVASDAEASASTAALPLSDADTNDKTTAELLRRAALLAGPLPAAAAVPVAPAEADPAAIRALSGTGLAPTAWPGARMDEMAGDLIRRSLDLSAPEAGFDVTRVNDWNAHLRALLPGGAYDISFPWVMPDCRNAAALDDESRRLCSEFTFSRPLLEATVGFYVRVGDPLAAAATRTELAGRRRCRPEGHFLFDLKQTGMTAPLMQLEAAPTAADCFARLLRGEVDMVTLLADEASASFGPWTSRGPSSRRRACAASTPCMPSR